MSLSTREYRNERRRESQFFHKLISRNPLSPKTLEWMAENGKAYSSATLDRYGVHEGVLARYQRNGSYSPAGGFRGFVCHLSVIIIPVGPVQRCYAYELPKRERWRVIPAGYGAQWLGDLSLSELILCEGEWDLFRLHDEGFHNAITHTAGAGTFLKEWVRLFQDKNIFIVYDVDAVGLKGARNTARLLHEVANVRLVKLPLKGTPEENDVSDFFRLGGAADQLRALLREGKKYERPIFFTRRDRAFLRAGRISI
ncbi:MAG: toprim domain-containing protein [Deltaproteobacteria bacterium]|nr:toprim domain-containing protein [Deltaproteobacteria bacterium]